MEQAIGEHHKEKVGPQKRGERIELADLVTRDAAHQAPYRPASKLNAGGVLI